MGLMPVYYTTTKLSGRKKSSVRNQRLNKDDHEKWLRKSMGIDKSWKPKSEPHKLSLKKSERYQSVGNGIGNGFVKTTSAISGDYIVGQAYNKGNLVVLSKEDAKDEYEYWKETEDDTPRKKIK